MLEKLQSYVLSFNFPSSSNEKNFQKLNETFEISKILATSIKNVII